MKKRVAACLAATALLTLPALAQTTNPVTGTTVSPASPTGITAPTGDTTTIAPGTGLGTNPTGPGATGAGTIVAPPTAGSTVGSTTAPTTAPTVGATAPGATQRTDPNTPAAAGNQNFITRREPGQIAIMGNDVYGANDEEIGEVEGVLIGANGQVTAIIVEVGGFLGIGETQVAIPWNSVRIQNQSQMNSNTLATSGVTSTSGATASSGASSQDRLTTAFTKDQLRNAPRFEDSSSTAGGQRPATGTQRQ